MKHILPILTAALALMATNVFGAFTYGEDWTVDAEPYKNANNEGGSTGKYFKITFSGKGKLYLADIFNNINSAPNESLDSAEMGVTQYGYAYLNKPGDVEWFDVNDPDNIEHFSINEEKEYFTYWDEKGKQTRYRNGYYLGEFEAGDEIEVYLTNGTDTFGSYTPINGVYAGQFGSRTEAFLPSMPIGALLIGGQQVNFGIIAVGSESDGGGGKTGLNGAPLPGGLQIALIAGLFGLGFWYVRRRKSVVA